ncbi:MAG: transglycosylase domain-containing protein [Cytophaga sp.]|uniref:transglycosylase domain-containing protein n=1 Tax=Cytophaga sp. TaxID=29535 RepID=UPI003F7CE61C
MKKVKIIAFTCVLYFFVYGIQLVLVHKFINPVVTPLMICRVIEGVFEGDFKVGIHKEWKDLDEISPNMMRAVLLAEDQNFFEHNGFNWENIKKAIEYNKKHKGKKIRGGSTISQQTAKNVFLPPSRTWIRKRG